MLDEKIRLAKDNFFKKNYFDPNSSVYKLTEKGNDEGQGKSVLTLNVGTDENICMTHYDKEGKCEFLNSQLGLLKRIDHFVLKKNNNKWELHMFEMKTTVTTEKIPIIKSKFLASYWNIRVFAMFLGIEFDIENVFLYTTYQDVELNIATSTNPRGHTPPLGSVVKSPEKEWNSKYLKIRIIPYSNEVKDEIEFKHTKIKMDLIDGTLIGTWCLA